MSHQMCDVAGTIYVRTETLENNIFYWGRAAPSSTLAVRIYENTMFPHATPLTNKTILDPRLVDFRRGQQPSSPRSTRRFSTPG